MGEKYIEKRNQEEKQNKGIYFEKLIEGIPLDESQKIFNIGYLFLQKIYYSLKLDNICKKISDKYRIKYSLNSILSNLIYTRIIEPCSKLSSYEASKNLLNNQTLNYMIFTEHWKLFQRKQNLLNQKFIRIV